MGENQQNSTISTDTNHFVLASGTKWPPALDTPQGGSGMGHATLGGDVVHELQRGIITMDCKKPWRPHHILSNQRGIEFKKRARILTVVAPEPGND